MAYGFGSTLGGGAGDRIMLPGRNLPREITISVAAARNGDGGSNVGRMFDQSGGMRILNVNSPATFQFYVDWSTQEGQWRAPRAAGGIFHHYGVVYDGRSTSNNPLMYLDGVSQTVTTAAAPTGTIALPHAPIYIGNRAAGDRNWDGLEAEFAIWNHLKPAWQMELLGRGWSPLYFPYGRIIYASLSSLIAMPGSIITGTRLRSHPLIHYPRSMQRIVISGGGGGGGVSPLLTVLRPRMDSRTV